MSALENPLLSRILLIRHGRSALGYGTGWLNADGFRRWQNDYDAAGLDPLDAPPRPVVDAVAAADAIVASDLRRAQESAARLAPLRQITTSPLLRETTLAAPALPLRLPGPAWDGLAHLLWGCRILLGTDTTDAERRRANAAIALLREFDGVASVALATHGVFRRLLAIRLTELGWTSTDRRSYACWSVWSFNAQHDVSTS